MTEYEFHNSEAMLSIASDTTKVPEAAEKPLFTEDEEGDVATWDGDSLRELDGHKVVFNPQNGDVFDVVTDEYVPIQPTEFIGPLGAELEERSRSVEGTFSMFDGGARGYLEVILSDSGIWPKDRDSRQEPVRTGVTVSWSHDGGVSVKARGFAQDGACKNTMRRVSDSVYVKHAGDVEARIDWEGEWSSILDQLGAFSDALERVIDAAFEHVVWDLSDHEFADNWLDVTDGLQKLEEMETPVGVTEDQRDGINGFYDLFDFPAYLSYYATDRVLWRLTQKDGDQYPLVTAWDLYSGMTYALTHQAQFESGSSSDDDYHRVASDILMNPELAEQSAGQEVQTRLREQAGEEETDTFGIETNTGDAMRQYKEREEQLREAFDG